MEELNFNDLTIGTGDSVFDDESSETVPETTETAEVNPPVETKENITTEEEHVDPESLFNPEGVGSGTNIQEKENTTENKTSDNTPPTTVFASIAEALKSDGILPDILDDDIKGIKDGDGFSSLIDKQVQAKLDETQKRINEALQADVPKDDIQLYENALGQLGGIKEDVLLAENEESAKLRQNLIYQDYLNKGLSKEKSIKAVKMSMDSGDEINDAKDALASLKSYYTEGYNSVLTEAQNKRQAIITQQENEAKELKKSMLEDEEVFKGIKLDSSMRKKAFDSITKPVYKDNNTGQYYTAIQKYQIENPTDFRKKLGVIYALTDGFKDIDKLAQVSSNKTYKRKISSLEQTLSNMSTNADGSLKFVGDNSPETRDSSWKIDI